MKICINAGHTKMGVGTGAHNDLIESVETRRVTGELIKLFASTTHEIVPAIFDVSADNLKETAELCNRENCDLLLSIHLNAGGGNGVETYTWRGARHSRAVKVCDEIHALGFKNRGVKDGSELYVIKNTKCQAILIECCFTDGDMDVELYDCDRIAKAIYQAVK